MKAFGVILLLLGAAIAAAGLFMTGAAPGERVLNIGLLNEKAMLATIGGALLVGGTVLFGAAEIVAAMGVRAAPVASDAQTAESQTVESWSSAPPDPQPIGPEAWRRDHTIVRSTRTGGKKVYFLADNTFAVEGLDGTFPDIPAALAASKSA